MNRIRMYQLLRKLDMVWFDRFIRDIRVEREIYDSKIDELIKFYEDNYV